MRKKIIASLMLAITVLLGVVIVVYAGATIDYGQVANFEGIDTPPPEGMVNWTAWNKSWADFMSGGIPQEILTEDNTNCDEGENLGYSNMGVEQQILIPNGGSSCKILMNLVHQQALLTM